MAFSDFKSRVFARPTIRVQLKEIAHYLTKIGTRTSATAHQDQKQIKRACMMADYCYNSALQCTEIVSPIRRIQHVQKIQTIILKLQLSTMHLHYRKISANNAYWLTNFRLDKLIHAFVTTTQQSRNVNSQRFAQRIRLSVLAFSWGKFYYLVHFRNCDQGWLSFRSSPNP